VIIKIVYLYHAGTKYVPAFLFSLDTVGSVVSRRQSEQEPVAGYAVTILLAILLVACPLFRQYFLVASLIIYQNKDRHSEN
jgi:hypothetical protein